MGRQLAFWKYKNEMIGTDGKRINDHRKIYETVCINEEFSADLEVLNATDILKHIADEFSHWDMLDEYNFESSEGSFTVNMTDCAVLFDCSWSMQPRELNKLIDIMNSFGCSFYDPQIDTRFSL